MLDPRVVAGRRVPTGTPLAPVDLRAIRARVRALTAVRQRRRVPGELAGPVHIAVTERHPVAVVERGGRSGLDDQGVLFRPLPVPPGSLP